MSAMPQPQAPVPSRMRDPISTSELERRWAATRTAMRSAGLDALVVQSAEDRVEYDPQLHHREIHPVVHHPDLGEVQYEGYPVKMSRTPAYIHGRAPLLAEHNQYVYGDLLGMSAAEIAGMRERGVI